MKTNRTAKRSEPSQFNFNVTRIVAVTLVVLASDLGAEVQPQSAAAAQTNRPVQQEPKTLATNWSKATLTQVREAAEQGDVSARFHLGRMYELGTGIPQDYLQAAKYYRMAAEQGHGMAQNNLGIFFLRGLGVSRDLSEAEQWFRRAAEQGETYGQANLAWMYFSGEGLAKNREQAEFRFRGAAEQGMAYAQFMMGQLAEHNGVSGNTVVGNYQVASEWYQKAAAQGHVKAMFSLGDLYYYGELGHNYPEAAKWFRKAAEKDDQEAVMRLGELYAVDHEDLPADLAEAAHWYRIAANHGNPEAQYQLGCLLADRKDNPDRTEAERWLKQAAANGYAEASVKLARLNQISPAVTLANINRDELEAASYRNGDTRLLLGQAYEEGRGGPTNLPAAAEVYWKILNQGPQKDQAEASRRLISLYAEKKLGFNPAAILGPKNPEAFAKLLQDYSRLVTPADAQFQVGEMLLRGETLPADKPQAVQWLTRAAQAGSAPAMNRLGKLWAAGLGGSPDAKEAANWYQRAATNGLAAAQFNLGCAFEKGEGVAQDRVEAAAWLRLATQQGSPEAREKVAALEASFSPGQIEAAKRRAGELAALLPQLAK